MVSVGAIFVLSTNSSIITTGFSIRLPHFKHYFTLFLIIEYSWILSTSSFSTELWLTQKSYAVPFKEILLYSSFVKSFDTLPKQNWCQLMLSCTLNL